MKIEIINIEFDKPTAEYPFKLVEGNLAEDYFDEAWALAIDDGLVDESSRLNYIIQFANGAEELEDFQIQ